MKYYYDLRCECHEDPRQYYTAEEMAQAKIYPATPEIEAKAMEDGSCLWPVYEPCGCSTEPVECASVAEARDYILAAANQSVYEYIHDI